MSYNLSMHDGTALSFLLPRDVRAPAAARAAVDSLSPFLPDSAWHAVRLVVSELVTNAVRHGDGPVVELKLSTTDGVISGEVIDDGEPFAPHAALPEDPFSPGRRGLAIVEALSRAWGVREGSTHVWFELGAAPAR